MNRFELERRIQSFSLATLSDFAQELHRYSKPRIYPNWSNDIEWSCVVGWRLDELFLTLLQMVEPAPDPRSVNSLDEEIHKYNTGTQNVDVNLQGLVRDGWVRIVWNRWYLPYNYMFSSHRHFEGDPSIVDFFEKMKKTPYPDQRQFYIPDFDSILTRHRSRYPLTPSEDWFVSSGIVASFDDDQGQSLVLNMHSSLLRAYSTQLCFHLWEDYSAGPQEKVERLGWWHERTEFLYPSLDFLKNMSNFTRSNFLDACLHQILEEEDLLDVDGDQRKVWAEAATRSGRLIVGEGIKSWLPKPSSVTERIFFDDSRQYEFLMSADEARGAYHVLISYIFVGEGISLHGRPQRTRFWELMRALPERPFLYRALSMACSEVFPELIADLLSKSETLTIGTLLLSRFVRSDSVDAGEQLWDKGLSVIGASLRRMNDPHSDSTVVVEILLWLARQKRVSRSRVRRSDHEAQREIRQYESMCELFQVMKRYSNASESFISQLIPFIFELVERSLNEQESKIESPYWDILLWLCEIVESESPDFNGTIYRFLFTSYRSIFRSELSYLSSDVESFVANKGWIAASVYMYVHHLQVWMSTLAVANGTLTDDPSPANVRRVKIRVHLRWLAYIVQNISKVEILSGISNALSLCFQAFQQDDFLEDSTVDAFSWLIEANGFSDVSANLEPLLVVLTRSINRFPQEQRSRVLEAFASSTTDPRRLAVIFNHLESADDRDQLQERLLVVTSGDFDTHTLTEVQSTINELLSTNVTAFVQRATRLYQEYDPVGKQRRIQGWDEWSYRTRLHIAFIQEDFDFIEQTELPDTQANRDQYQATKRFYQALVHFQRGGLAGFQQAIQEFRWLHNRYSSEQSYLINLVASYARFFSEVDEAGNTGNPARLEARVYTEELLGQVSNATTPDNVLAVINSLYLYIALGSWEEYQTALDSIPAILQQQLSVSLTRLDALIKQGRWDEAEFVFAELKIKHGDIPEVEKYRNQLNEHTNSRQLSVGVSKIAWNWEEIADAIARLEAHTDPNDQARAYLKRGDMTYEKFLQVIVLQSCLLVKEYAPYLMRDNQISKEDTYSKLLSLFIQEKVAWLGWKVDYQGHLGVTGGISSNGEIGHGEPDIVISNNGHRLAVIEAIRLLGMERRKTQSHILKIRGYDLNDCFLYFHVIWSGVSDWSTLWTGYEALVADMNNWNEGVLPLVNSRSSHDLALHPSVERVPHFESEHRTSQGDWTIRYMHTLLDVSLGEQLRAGAVSRSL